MLQSARQGVKESSPKRDPRVCASFRALRRVARANSFCSWGFDGPGLGQAAPSNESGGATRLPEYFHTLRLARGPAGRRRRGTRRPIMWDAIRRNPARDEPAGLRCHLSTEHGHTDNTLLLCCAIACHRCRSGLHASSPWKARPTQKMRHRMAKMAICRTESRPLEDPTKIMGLLWIFFNRPI